MLEPEPLIEATIKLSNGTKIAIQSQYSERCREHFRTLVTYRRGVEVSRTQVPFERELGHLEAALSMIPGLAYPHVIQPKQITAGVLLLAISRVTA